MRRLLFFIGLFLLSIQIGLSACIDSLQWIEMPVRTYPDYPIRIKQIDSVQFYQNKCPYKTYDTFAPIVKKKKKIKVKCANKMYKFRDKGDECGKSFYVEGSYKSWIIIKGYLYCHYEQYYMINPKTGGIDSLAGEPLFYEDKILCIEEDNTDGTKMIEVWQIHEDVISLIYSADLKRRKIYNIDDFYLLNDAVFLKTGKRYLKMYYGDTSTNQGFQPFKYNGKELDRVHGLDWYDYGARRYGPAYCMFTQMDPLAEQYPHLSPYAYCAGNPVRYVDPDGRHIKVKKRDGMFIIDGGEVDDDLNIYDVSNGWDNRVSIGEALTQYSFFNDEGNPVKGSIISLSDNSGNEFLTDFVNNTPSILTYIFNATEGKKYDFKRQNAPDPSLISPDLYNNRGMKVSINGNNYVASARDIGNYAAGYIAGQNGLTWTETRVGFDALETRQHHFLPSIEGRPSQYAQFKGYTSGLKNLSLTKALMIKLIEYKVFKMLLP